MALFFDRVWFEARVAEAGLCRDHVCAALGIDGDELDLVLKDQRELSAREVRVLAGLLGVEAGEMARRAGAGTPDGAPTTEEALVLALRRIKALESRVLQLEAYLSANGKNFAPDTLEVLDKSAGE